MFTRLHLIWWAILGRPIIHNVKLKVLELDAGSQTVFIAGNTIISGS